MVSHITVLGAGVWGLALASVLAKNNQMVTLWDNNAALIEEIAGLGRHPRYPENIRLPSSIRFSKTLKEALEQAHHILIAVPSHAFLEALQLLKPLITEKQGILWATKGLLPGSEFLHQAVLKEWGSTRHYAVLSGPSFALEVAAGLPTAVVIASPDKAYAEGLAACFRNQTFQVDLTQDVIGVQLGGVVKNVLAVVVGISDGLEMGANARAALIVRGLNEMTYLAKVLGAKSETMMGLAGCGDIILTCTDNQSRNRRFGLALAQGLTKAEALEKVGQVVEAVYNVEQLCHLAKINGMELPIAEQVFRVMKQELTPRQAILALFE